MFHTNSITVSAYCTFGKCLDSITNVEKEDTEYKVQHIKKRNIYKLTPCLSEVVRLLQEQQRTYGTFDSTLICNRK